VTPPQPKSEPVVTAPPPAPAAAAPAPPPAASAADVEKPAIEASIHEYAKALSSMNLQAISRVRVYTPTEAKNWENAFKNYAEYRFIVTIKDLPR